VVPCDLNLALTILRVFDCSVTTLHLEYDGQLEVYRSKPTKRPQARANQDVWLATRLFNRLFTGFLTFRAPMLGIYGV
jgi:hypothetical protein